MSKDRSGRRSAAEALGLRVDIRNGVVGKASGSVVRPSGDYTVEVRWTDSNRDAGAGTDVRVSLPAPVDLHGLRWFWNGSISRHLLRIVSRNRVIKADRHDIVLAVPRGSRDALDAWLTPMRVETLRTTRAWRFMDGTLLFESRSFWKSGSIDSEDEIVGLVNGLIDDAERLA